MGPHFVVGAAQSSEKKAPKVTKVWVFWASHQATCVSCPRFSVRFDVSFWCFFPPQRAEIAKGEREPTEAEVSNGQGDDYKEPEDAKHEESGVVFNL